MSIYYNLKKLPKLSNDYNVPCKFEDFLEKPVIDDMSKYEVGVKRFKIPINNVDFYRVYQGSMMLGLHTYPQKRYNELDETIVGETRYPYDLFIDNDYCKDDFDATDKNRLEGNVDSGLRSGNYIPINSQVEFCNLLTRRMLFSFGDTYYNNARNSMLAIETDSVALGQVQIPANCA